MNNLIKLLDYGQSYWLDNLTRGKIKKGEIKNRVTQQGLRGITSNPSIFNKAISKGNDYDAQIKQLVREKKSVREIYEALTVKDVQDACDILKSVYDESNGTDGLVSLEVSPYLARDTEGTIKEARRLFSKVDRPNCFIKIPGTDEGIPAIEQCLYEGININITLLFSIQSYEAVALAYIKALERRLDEGKDIKNIASVASFFLSRIDVLTDQLLGHYIIPEKTTGEPRPENLLGKAAIASAKIAYQSFKNIFSGERWQKLSNNGARVQKPLWASTSTKDPLYPDVRYVETLIGPHTVNTLPDETIDAFADHGKLIENSIEHDIDEARQTFENLGKLGVDINFVTRQLVNEGIQKFISPYDNLMKTLADKRSQFLSDKTGTQEIDYGKNKSEIISAFSSLDEKQIARRIYSKDPFVWKSEEKETEAIRNRLGWLDVGDFINRADEIIDFAKEIKKEKFKYVVLLGMGGSSLCPEVARETFGSKQGFPKLLMLDNTDPAAVKNVESQVDLNKTLFIVASKSGTTTETLSFDHYFFNLLKDKGIKNPGRQFIAITDDNTSLQDEAKERKFRKVFTNPDDYGGRYSALSYFGLVPMALIGINIKEILYNAHQMEINSGPFIPSDSNPGISLGTVLGMNARLGRDKVTFVLSKSISAFGYWVEQLIAESTGKEGNGILPVESEDLDKPEVYGNDRIFVYMHAGDDDKKNDERKLNILEKAGHPVIKIDLKNKLALGAEFFRWELATATAGRIISVNPFNEPNVSESKKNSKDLLNEWQKTKSFDEEKPIVNQNISVFYNSDADWVPQGKSVSAFLNSFVKLARSPDYIALLAYFLQTPQRQKLLQSIRMKLRNKLKVATTLGYGPRYMHSTGQLHKGGPNNGVFIMFTYDAKDDLPIPGQDYGFATLQKAQALGDFRSLNNKNRRVIRIHLEGSVEQALKKINESLK
ncbi:bifunctional transaldolase/phosoglucose isomerase [bacterium BMS3Abin03]|nr:bifunctional transaldolase/phosoglucose isomerase [bacterium BMS3Abin03]MCG6958273.1 bifunctional transaldolase/phosoglucose isomerase [bacterium BMS3Abin03]